MIGRFIRALELRLATRRALRAAKSQSQAALARGGIRRVLVLCHGNIYRSPFVAGMLEASCPELEVRSAGFHHRPGRASPDSHIKMSAALGVSLGSHRSALVTAEDAAWADLIVLMDRHNWARLRRLGVSGEKVVWLGAL
jgi:protein-tyrosine phosphatase